MYRVSHIKIARENWYEGDNKKEISIPNLTRINVIVIIMTAGLAF